MGPNCSGKPSRVGNPNPVQIGMCLGHCDASCLWEKLLSGVSSIRLARLLVISLVT